MGTFNIQQIEDSLMSNKDMQNKMAEVAEKFVEECKNGLIEEFESHPVTAEIKNGADSSNISGTLAGKGNLFSFIGFGSGYDPISPVLSLLRSIKLSKTSIRRNKNSIEFRVSIPEQEKFESVTKMPWESGRSWLYDIERGISGLAQYLYGRFSSSRSGTAVQSERNITNQSFMPVKYFGAMLQKFDQKLKRGQ